MQSRNSARKDYNVDSFRCINELDVSYDTRIVYFGDEGSYSQQAMERFFGKGGYISYARQKFTDVMKAVSEGEADYGVVPIENSSTGGITVYTTICLSITYILSGSR